MTINLSAHRPKDSHYYCAIRCVCFFSCISSIACSSNLRKMRSWKFRQIVVCRNKSLASHENKIADNRTWHQSTENHTHLTTQIENNNNEEKIKYTSSNCKLPHWPCEMKLQKIVYYYLLLELLQNSRSRHLTSGSAKTIRYLFLFPFRRKRKK